MSHCTHHASFVYMHEYRMNWYNAARGSWKVGRPCWCLKPKENHKIITTVNIPRKTIRLSNCKRVMSAVVTLLCRTLAFEMFSRTLFLSRQKNNALHQQFHPFQFTSDCNVLSGFYTFASPMSVYTLTYCSTFVLFCFILTTGLVHYWQQSHYSWCH